MNTYNITSHGAGDAFGGNKIINADVFIETLQVQINESISLRAICRVLVEALESFRKNDSEKGMLTLSCFSMMEFLDDEAKLAISSLRILMSEECLNEDELVVEKYSRSQSYSIFTKELTEAAILKLIEVRQGKEAADKYFKTLPEQIIPQYIYLQRLATEEYVYELVERKLEQSDFILGALFEKTLELSMIPECQSVLEQLRELKPLESFRRETVILECLVTDDLREKNYFCLTLSEKLKFDNLRDSLIELLDPIGAPDFKVLHMLSQLFHYTQYTCVVIGNSLGANITHLDAKQYFNNEVLQSVLTRVPLTKFKDIETLSPEELSLELINQKDKDFCNFPVSRLLYERGDTDLIVGTIKSLSEQGSMSAKANLLALAAICSPILSRQEFPQAEIEEILDEHLKGVMLNIPFVDSLAPDLAHNGHVEIAVKLYKAAFGEHFPWLSEAYFSYLNILHQARQYNSLNKRLMNLSNEEKQREEVTTLYSLMANTDKNYELAASLLRKNIGRYLGRRLELHEKRNFVYLWGQYLETIYQESPDKAHEMTGELPLTIFDDYFNEYSWRLMFFYSHRINEVAEKMLDWLFYDPHSNAKHYFKIIMHASQNFEKQVWPESSGKYKSAFHYKENHQSHIKISVPTRFVKNCAQYLLDSSGKVATKLDNAHNGEAMLLPVKLCTLVEKLHPVIAAYHIAQQIMDEDEHEVFHILSLPKDATGEEIMEEIEKFMASINEQRNELQPLMKADLPINMKYKYLNGLGNVEKALLAVLCKDVRISITSDSEEPRGTNCNDFVLDEVTAVYLACVGKHIFPECSWHMTEAVYESLSRFSTGYAGKWPIYHESHNTVYFKDDRCETAITADFINNLADILGNTTVYSDIDLDTPLNLKLKLKELCTESFFLSLALAEQLKFGFFCIDAGTRNVIRSLYANSIPFIPDRFYEAIVSNKDCNAIANMLWLNMHTSFSSMSFDSISLLIFNGNNEQLKLLVRFVEEQNGGSWGEWGRETIVGLIRDCLRKMIFEQKISERTEDLEQLLLGLLVLLTKGSSISEGVVDALIRIIPMSLLFEGDGHKVSFKYIDSVRNVLDEVSQKYETCISKSLRKNKHSTSAFWKTFTDRCSLIEE